MKNARLTSYSQLLLFFFHSTFDENIIRGKKHTQKNKHGNYRPTEVEQQKQQQQQQQQKQQQQQQQQQQQNIRLQRYPKTSG